jgi:hypothetical protein
MVATRAAKRAVIDALHPLNHLGILAQVLQFVGGGNYLFLALVSNKFCFCCSGFEVCTYEGYDENNEEVEAAIYPTSSTLEAVYESPARLKFAVACGFSIDTSSIGQLRAGWLASIDTLDTLHKSYGMPLTAQTSRGAAESGSISKLAWLLDERTCEQAEDVCNYAVLAKTTDALKWLRKRGAALTAATCSAAARSANACSVVQYLVSEGCPVDAEAAVNAASYGDMELLQFLHKQVSCEHFLYTLISARLCFSRSIRLRRVCCSAVETWQAR